MDAQEATEVRVGDLSKRLREVNARIIDEDVDPTPGVDRSIDNSLDDNSLRNRPGDSDRFTSFSLNSLDCRFSAFLVEIINHDLGATATKEHRMFLSHALGPASDDRHPAVKSEFRRVAFYSAS
ncbi:hypothetical protein HG531_008376 [Fusarium graminearum]|nr:hypothetical protein HG531_008376 [Fusarium graminearum]